MRKATEEELQAQRRSWVLGEAEMGSDKDETEYRAALERGDTETVRRLEAEGKARRQRALNLMDRLKV